MQHSNGHPLWVWDPGIFVPGPEGTWPLGRRGQWAF
jgi:hypothetical protein